ncbi:hypothetical protein TNCV_4068671 [Trichonephila clavipes]|nr:hypothetical protein TNCV_4068671 [Trichonephila clavipes]
MKGSSVAIGFETVIRKRWDDVVTPSVFNPPTGQNGFFRPTREASKRDCTDFSAFKAGLVRGDLEKQRENRGFDGCRSSF